jgi:dUTPase
LTEEVALEQVAAQLGAELVVGVRGHAVGQHLAGVALQLRHRVAQPVVAEVEHVELDDVEELEQRRGV